MGKMGSWMETAGLGRGLRRSKARVVSLGGATLALVLLAGVPVGGLSACSGTPWNGGNGGGDAPPVDWFDTTLDPDLSYLPLGPLKYEVLEVEVPTGAGPKAPTDLYMPIGSPSKVPLVLFLPGAGVTKDRYSWVAHTLASHGFATAVMQAPGGFARGALTPAALAYFESESQKAEAPWKGRLDLSRVILSGHSLGSYLQSSILDPQTCVPGFCTGVTERPKGIRGLLLFAFHRESLDGEPETRPVVAADIPWLIVNGTEDGLTTLAKADATYERLLDRPVTLVTVGGMNHFQFTDYVNPSTDTELGRDNPPLIPNREARAVAASYAVAFVKRTLANYEGNPGPRGIDIPEDLGASRDPRVTVRHKGGRLSSWPTSPLPPVVGVPVATPGLDGTTTNADIVATKFFQGATYLLVRNDQEGAGLFRMDASGLQAVPLPMNAKGKDHAGPGLNTLLGAMEVFQGRLYVGFSSGFQGSKRQSVGAELWAFDGKEWTPIAANGRDKDPEVRIETLVRCEKTGPENSVSVKVTLPSGVRFERGQWAGGVLDNRETQPSAAPVIYDVVGNEEDTLILQSRELALVGPQSTCRDLPVGSSFHLRKGLDESGFGQPWNKAITAMTTFQGRLLVATGLNYADGAALYGTSDGTTFQPVLPQVFFGRHADGTPISSSITALQATTFEGEETLFVAANGTNNYGARLALWQGGQARFLVDGTTAMAPFEKAGFGRSLNQVASMAVFQNRLWMGSFDFAGLEILSLGLDQPRGLPSHDWRVDVGTGGPIERGWGDPNQIVARLFVARDQLWVGDAATLGSAAALRDQSAYTYRTANGRDWQLVSAHGFGWNAVSVSQLFLHDGKLFGAAASAALSQRETYAPIRLFNLREEGH